MGKSCRYRKNGRFVVRVCAFVNLGKYKIVENYFLSFVHAFLSISFDPDLRSRHTFWTGTIAAYFSWIPLFAGTQAQIQRYLSVPTMRQARQ